MKNLYSPLLATQMRRWLGALAVLAATAGAAQAQTTTFTYSAPGSAQTYIVPAGVTRLQVVATGGSGGANVVAPAPGAQVTATLAVTPNEVLTVVVGGQGSSRGAGGYNGGGAGSPSGTGGTGASGGGATDIRRAAATARTDDYLASRNALLVAGGGGGSSVFGSRDYMGGTGGTPTGGNGAGGAFGGPGATQTGAGAGLGNSGVNNMGGAGSNGSGGTSGGGGGGYYGGGGGFEGSGGGGSSWVAPSSQASTVVYTVATAAGNGSLTITPLVVTAPVISSQPASTSACAGTSASFTVAASGTAPLRYQWYKGTTALSDGATGSGSTISGATTATLTLVNVSSADAATTYRVIVTAGTPGVSTTSADATLTVNAVPTIITQPASTTANAGTNVSFSVSGSSPGSPSFQWYKDGTALRNGATGSGSTISGATSFGLTISTLSAADAGSYYLTVLSSNGCATNSNPATLTVLSAPTVTTATPTNITTSSATLGGSITSNGGVSSGYSFGLVYVQGTGTPTTSNTLGGAPGGSSGSSGPSSFSGLVGGLMPGTTYTVRAYATNSAGTSYGSAVSFTTLLPMTAAPVLTTPANGSTTSGTPTFAGTAPAGSTVTLYLAAGSGAAQAIGTTTATGGSFSFVPGTALASGSYSAYATAQSSGAPVSVNSNTNTFTVDTTPPTATVYTTAGSPASTSPIPFAAAFSEPVTGFTASGISVTNGTVTGGTVSGSGSGPYTFSVTPTGNGPVTVSLLTGAAQDAVGNASAATNSVSVQYTAPVVSGLSVLYQTGDLGQPTDNQLRPFLQLVNSGTTAVPYSGLTVRYWLTPENFMGQLATPIDYAKLGTSLVSARYVQLATPRQGAFGYIEYSFAAGAGSLAAGTDSGPIYGKAYKPDYTNFNETDDWSYQTSSSFTTNSHVTLYQNGTLIGGTEPPAVATTTNIRVLTGNQDISTNTSYINVTLQVSNAGNRPVNYSDLTVRYYFTRDGATTIVPNVDYAKLGANNISVRYVPLSTPLNGADGYLEIGFSSALGVFYPLTNTDVIQFKIRKGDYTAFNQTNDYSFSPSSAVVEQPRVPAYLNGALLFGTEPSSASSNTAARGSQPVNASASGATIVAASSGLLEQALTASPNPFSEQLTLRFALPTAQAYTLAVYDGQGRLVQQVASGEAQAEQAQEVAVPTQGYAAGLYLVRLTTATDVQQFKLVKH